MSSSDEQRPQAPDFTESVVPASNNQPLPAALPCSILTPSFRLPGLQAVGSVRDGGVRQEARQLQQVVAVQNQGL